MRELRNTLEQTVLLTGAQAIDADQIAISPGLTNGYGVMLERRSFAPVAALNTLLSEKIVTNLSDDNQDLLKKSLEKRVGMSQNRPNC